MLRPFHLNALHLILKLSHHKKNWFPFVCFPIYHFFSIWHWRNPANSRMTVVRMTFENIRNTIFRQKQSLWRNETFVKVQFSSKFMKSQKLTTQTSRMKTDEYIHEEKESLSSFSILKLGASHLASFCYVCVLSLTVAILFFEAIFSLTFLLSWPTSASFTGVLFCDDSVTRLYPSNVLESRDPQRNERLLQQKQHTEDKSFLGMRALCAARSSFSTMQGTFGDTIV